MSDSMLIGPHDFRTGSGSDRIIDATVSLMKTYGRERYISRYVEHKIRSLPKPKLDVGRATRFQNRER